MSCDSLLRHRFAEMTRRDAFDKVMAGLRAADAAGLTPNPCVRCNGHVRLDAMLELVREAWDQGFKAFKMRFGYGPELPKSLRRPPEQLILQQ